jgi:very-short-patch-repair endonuclease
MRKSKYNWEEIQKKYDSGMSWRELMKEYGFGWKIFDKWKKRGFLKSRSKSEANILDHKKNPERYKHSKETKKKLSEIRTKYLKEHPDQVPYLLNHYSRGDSYPERYFKELFEVEKIDLKHHTQIGIYQLDFYNLECKLDIEIDGDQHHLDKRIVESDIRRTEFLESQGWRVFRVKWSEYQKLPMDARKELIDKIRKMIII